MSAEKLPLRKILFIGKEGDAWLRTLQSTMDQHGCAVEVIARTELTRALRRESPEALGVIIDATTVPHPYNFGRLATRWLPGNVVWVAGSAPNGVGIIEAERRGFSYLQKNPNADYLTAVLQGPRLTLSA